MTVSGPEPGVHQDPGVHQQPDDVNSRWVAWVALAFLVITAISVGIANLMITEDPQVIHTPGPLVDGIHTGSIDRQARGVTKAREATQRLRQLGWVDQARGIAHVPIEDAKRLWLQQVQGPQPSESKEAP